MQRNKNGIPILPAHSARGGFRPPFDLAPLRNIKTQCQYKLRHADRGSAIAHAKAAGPEFRAYCCPWCADQSGRLGWHIGHSEETRVISVWVKP